MSTWFLILMLIFSFVSFSSSFLCSCDGELFVRPCLFLTAWWSKLGDMRTNRRAGGWWTAAASEWTANTLACLLPVAFSQDCTSFQSIKRCCTGRESSRRIANRTSSHRLFWSFSHRVLWRNSLQTIPLVWSSLCSHRGGETKVDDPVQLIIYDGSLDTPALRPFLRDSIKINRFLLF